MIHERVRHPPTVDSTAAAYTYGANGDRVRKDSGGSFTEYIYFAGQPIAEKNASGWTDYIFDGDQRIAMATGSAATSTQYYHADHLGSERLITDASGNVISSCLYAPFGQQVSCSPDSAANHYRFTGKERDRESNLDYFGSRYYESNQGTFLKPDEPFADQDVNSPQSFGLYTYVQNSPLRFTDFEGMAHVDSNGYWIGDYNNECAKQNGVVVCWNSAANEWQASNSTEEQKGAAKALVNLPIDALTYLTPAGWLFVGLSGHPAGLAPTNREQQLGMLKFQVGISILPVGELLLPEEIEEIATAIAGGHAFVEHAEELRAAGVSSPKQLEDTVKEIIMTGEARKLSGGRTAYWDSSKGMVVIVNPNTQDKGTIFVPTRGRAYFDDLH